MKKIHILFLLSFIFCNGQNKTTINKNLNNEIIKATVLTYNSYISYTPSIINKEIISVYLSNDFVFSESKFIKETRQNEVIDDMSIILKSDSDIIEFNEITFDIKNKKLKEYVSEDFVLEDYFVIEETIPTMNWEFFSEQKQIGDFLCEKAITTFRGRTYEVWYTTEIPITYGPWKFNGLPGLMVEIKDTQGIYSWQLTSVKNDVDIDLNLKTISEKNMKFKPFTYKDYDSFWLKKRIELDKMKISRIDSEYKISLSFSTETNKEPINEWRTQTQWETSN